MFPVALRILIYCDDHGNGGAAMATHRLALGLAGRGHDVRYAQTTTQAAVPRLTERAARGITHVPIPYDTIRYYKPSIDDVRMPTRLLVEQRPDLVIFSDALVESTLGAKAAAAFLSVPYLTIKHLVLADGLYARDGEMGDRVRRSLAASAGAITVSDENRAVLAGVFPEHAGRIASIYNNAPDVFFEPVDPARRAAFRAAHDIPDGAIAVLTAAAMVERKGFHLQAELIKWLKRTGDLDRFVFVWAGEEDAPYFDPLWADLCTHGCDGAIRRIGYRKDMPVCLDGCDAMLLPSYGEGMPLTLLEAMAKGVPALVSAVGGCIEAAGAGEGCVLLPDPAVDAAGSVVAMRRTLLEWAQFPERRAAQGAAARVRAQALFSTDAMLSGYEAAIRRAVLAPGDYVSPGLPLIKGDWDMSFIAPAPPERLTPAQAAGPHTRYVDIRFPRMPIAPVDRDECHILYAAALRMNGKRALKAAYSFGWIAYHLLMAGMQVDILDGYLLHPELRSAVTSTLPPGSGERTRLVVGTLEEILPSLAEATPEPWSLAVLDLRRPGTGSETVLACAARMADDALLFVLGLNDNASLPASGALQTLQGQGWRAGLFQTANGLGLAWRGAVAPPPHIPDPALGLG